MSRARRTNETNQADQKLHYMEKKYTETYAYAETFIRCSCCATKIYRCLECNRKFTDQAQIYCDWQRDINYQPRHICWRCYDNITRRCS